MNLDHARVEADEAEQKSAMDSVLGDINVKKGDDDDDMDDDDDDDAASDADVDVEMADITPRAVQKQEKKAKDKKKDKREKRDKKGQEAEACGRRR